MADNIRQFPGTDIPEQTLSVEREPFGYCAHDKISLDEHQRTVRCAKCRKVFDPFDFLKNEVHRIQRAWDDYRFMGIVADGGVLSFVQVHKGEPE